MKLQPSASLLAVACALFLGVPVLADDAVVHVDAGKVLLEREQSLIGANIEDLNFQLYGGLYSQLLHGESFEEHVDPGLLVELKGPDRFAVWVLLDEKGQPLLRYFPGRRVQLYIPDGPVDWKSTEPRGKDKKEIAGISFHGGVCLPAEMPPEMARQLISLATGDSQVSRHWSKVQQGSAAGKLTLLRQGQLNGKQAQQIQFESGDGELGIDNAGLFHEGIKLVANQPYEAVLRIKSDAAQRVFFSLRDSTGKVLVEEPIDLAAKAGEYQKVSFALTPSASDGKGRFALTLKKPGTIVVDYAFLQAGPWGRFNGLAVRKDMAGAMLAMGVKTMRYNGSMLNKIPDAARSYKWKKMIGPRDERPAYEGFFNPYASHGFTFFDFLDLCETTGILPMFGVRTDETEQDIADLVDYCLAGPENEWGRRRAGDGHPRPYALKAIEIGNEEQADAAYFERVQALGAVIWKKNKDIDIVLSTNVGRRPRPEPLEGIAKWARSLGHEKRLVLDSHYLADVDEADKGLAAQLGMTVRDALAKTTGLEGFDLRLWPMEENGERCDWHRGLGHAHNLNAMNRMPGNLERAGTANTFQAWDLALAWDQGRIHFSPTQFVYQPSYYVDRMFADEWLPIVLSADSSLKSVDALAKKSRDGKILTIYLTNISSSTAQVSLKLDGFSPENSTVIQIGNASLEAKNTIEAPETVKSHPVQWKWEAEPKIELPGYSFTAIRLARR